MKRQLFWEGLTETTLIVLPLVFTPSVRRSVNAVVNSITNVLRFSSSSSSSSSVISRNENDHQHGCALCGEVPARTAYVSDDNLGDDRCKHVFCYLCAYRALADSSPGQGFKCPRCHKRVINIIRAGVDSLD